MVLSLIWGEGWKRKTFVEVRLCSVTEGGISYHWKGKFAAATKFKTKQKTYISFCINIPKPAKDDFLSSELLLLSINTDNLELIILAAIHLRTVACENE